MSSLAPAILSIYSIPSEWIGLKPAMILFNRFAHENLENLNFLEEYELEKLEEYELEKAVQKSREAAEIFSKYLSNCPELVRQHPEISETFREINISIKTAERLQKLKIKKREGREKEERQQSLYDEKQKRQEVENYWEYVQQERIQRGLRYGVPPKDTYTCPRQFPIRATANTKRRKSDARGIYYYEDERDVEVYWCFASEEEAKAENFRRPYKTPPKRDS